MWPIFPQKPLPQEIKGHGERRRDRIPDLILGTTQSPQVLWRAPAPPIILSRLVPNNHSGESIKQEKTMEEQL